jgi:inactivated superfamily I helicase
MGLENLAKITIVTAVNENEHDVMEKVTQSILSDSQSDVFVTDSKSSAMKILHSN